MDSIRFTAAIIMAAMLAVCTHPASAGRAFSDDFRDSTLRVDFVMSGQAGAPAVVAFCGLSKTKGWGGRRSHLSEILREGGAEATLTDFSTGDTLYRHTFCTLFQEWLITGDSIGPAAMEGTVLLPYPRRKAKLTVTLRDNRRSRLTSASRLIDPADILTADRSIRKPLPHTYIYRGENPDTAKIAVAILAEGYTVRDMPDFLAHTRETVDAILDHEPFASMAESFDFIAIESESRQSGVSVPNHGLWRDTTFDSHFSTFRSDRYLTSPRVHAIYDAITGTPCQHIIILANTSEYGGGGIYNLYTITAADNEKFRTVVVHEFGHSFAGLADEYFYEGEDFADETYPPEVEPWEPNITTQVNFASKWEPLIAGGEASLIEGAGYRAKGIWRSHHDCRMRSNNADGFCPACRQAIKETITWLTGQNGSSF